MAKDTKAKAISRTATSARFLLDDLAWLQHVLSQMGEPDCPRERRLVEYYRELARQRRCQLGALRKGHPQTWREYLS